MSSNKNLNAYVESLENLKQTLKDLHPQTANKEEMIRQAEGMIIFIRVFQTQKGKAINDQISYQNLLRLESEALMEMIEATLESDEIAPEDIRPLQQGQQDIKSFSQSIEKKLADYGPKDLDASIRKIYFGLPWNGDSGYLTFKTPELLAEIVSKLCEAKMAMGGEKTIKFEIFLAPPSETKAERMKNTGETNEAIETKYAKFAYEAAAKKGFSPDNCIIVINNSTISPKESRFTGLYDDWKNKASEKKHQLRKDTWSNTLKESAPEVPMSKPKRG